MPKRALISTNDLQHNVPALVARARMSLQKLAQMYFLMEVAGQTQGTIEAKRRDLGQLLAFYAQLYGHDHPEEWFHSMTREFPKQLRKGRPAQATVVRTYTSVRHFARWVHQKVKPFPLGCPTEGVKPPRRAGGRMEGTQPRR